jgi:hypothetical protein
VSQAPDSEDAPTLNCFEPHGDGDLEAFPARWSDRDRLSAIAEILGCASGTIKSRCVRGRAKLVLLLSHLRSGH